MTIAEYISQQALIRGNTSSAVLRVVHSWLASEKTRMRREKTLYSEGTLEWCRRNVVRTNNSRKLSYCVR